MKRRAGAGARGLHDDQTGFTEALAAGCGGMLQESHDHAASPYASGAGGEALRLLMAPFSSR